VAYLLSLLRLPFALIPYLTKLIIALTFKTGFRQKWDSYTFQTLRLGGDFINFFLTAGLLEIILCSFKTDWNWRWVYLIAGAEAIRLLLEKGQMLFSGAWQLLPHRAIARRILWLTRPPLLIGGRLSEFCSRYCEYYLLSDDLRTEFILRALKTRAGNGAEAAEKLSYTESLRIVPCQVGLRAGIVRNIAGGEIFIHARWTNDPWLLAGQILRRTPWMFDPRYLRRPFYYRTGSNRLATLFVLQHADYSLPYAWYQLGHEIKVARYDFFYRVCRRLGLDIEPPVQEDGTFKFDQFMEWLGLKPAEAATQAGQRPLWTDAEVIADILARPDREEIPSAQEIAARYTYPLKYVREVLLPELTTAYSHHDPNTPRTTAATSIGASQ
jgi:hypothetical protein